MLTLAELHVKTHAIVFSAISRGSVERPQNSTLHLEYSAIETQTLQKLTSIRALPNNTKCEVHMNSRFAREAYSQILDRVDRIFRSSVLIAYSTGAFNSENLSEPASDWLQELRLCATSSGEVEARFTAAISTCGVAIAQRQPLPPHLDIPEASSLLNFMRESAMDLLDTRHAYEPGYLALATIHASALLAAEDLRELALLTSELRGGKSFWNM